MSANSVGSHTLSGLVAKRAELSGQIEALQVRLRKSLIGLEALDATIRLFDPEYNIEAIRPKPTPAIHKAFPGDILRLVLSLLRDKKGPVSTKEITLHVMVARGIDTNNKNDFRLFRQRVGSVLRHHRANGLLRSVPGPDGLTLFWDIGPNRRD